MPATIRKKFSSASILFLLLSAILLPVTAGTMQGVDGQAAGTTAAGWNSLGNTYSSQLRWDIAADAYTRAIEIDPGFARAYFNRGKAFAELGRYEEAIEDYRKAVEHDPSLAGVVENFLEIAVRNSRGTFPGDALIRGHFFPGGQFLAVDNTRGRSDVVIALTPQGQRGAILAVFVAKGHSRRFDQVIPPGIYDVYITTGEHWNQNTKSFAVETGHLLWKAPQVFAGPENRGLTLTFIDWSPPASWLEYSLVPIAAEKFPVL